MDLNTGDKVVVIDEKMSGEVLSVLDDVVVIYCEDGFEYEYNKSQLMKVGIKGEVEFQKSSYKVSPDRYVIKEEVYPIQIKLSGKKPSIDLHIEDLAPNFKFDYLHEVLSFQLNHVRHVLSVASKNRIRNLIFVHGVGKGVLREELRKMLAASYPSVEYFDGAYTKFGAGATEVIIHKF